jgi:hypothetical protein
MSPAGAHLAGALGVPTTILLNDKRQFAWPVEGEESLWYPRTQLVFDIITIMRHLSA